MLLQAGASEMLWLLLALLFQLFHAAKAELPPVVELQCWDCTAESYSNHSGYAKNVDILLEELVKNVPITKFFSTSAPGSTNTSEDRVYGMLQCRADSSPDACKQCAEDLVREIKAKCSGRVGAKTEFKGCFLRYDNHSFFSVLDESRFCSGCSNTTVEDKYIHNMNSAMLLLVDETPKGNGSATAAVGSGASQVYAFGQCRGDLSPEQCKSCISADYTKVSSQCSGKSTGSMLLDSCYVKFDSVQFFSGPPNSTSSHLLQSKTSHTNSRILKLVLGIIFGLLGLCILTFCFIKNSHKCRPSAATETTAEDADLQANISQGAVIFSYQTLEAATNSFHNDNKLGEGGFGVVYKGTLADGKDVAIKRLFVASQQGRREFLNEVKLVSGVQHRNLVKLYGCCAVGSERLLVYELLKNNCLSKSLFDQNESTCLSWDQRYHILIDVARGLAYLHEESQIRIVHRDIKAANILLDEKFRAKIADFGLARLYLDEDKSMNTRVAGTLGYMAPEYALHGHLSEKADVFSFGILSLEIVSGLRNTDLKQPPGQEYLVEWTWKLYEEDRLLDLLDPRLSSSLCDLDEVRRVICVGLLCGQASATQRPSMSRATTMISGEAKVDGLSSRPAMLELVDGVVTVSNILSSSTSGGFISTSQSSYSPR